MLECLQYFWGHGIFGDMRGSQSLLCTIKLMNDRYTLEPIGKDAKLCERAIPAMRVTGIARRSTNLISIFHRSVSPLM